MFVFTDFQLKFNPSFSYEFRPKKVVLKDFVKQWKSKILLYYSLVTIDFQNVIYAEDKVEIKVIITNKN